MTACEFTHIGIGFHSVSVVPHYLFCSVSLSDVQMSTANYLVVTEEAAGVELGPIGRVVLPKTTSADWLCPFSESAVFPD